MRHFYTLPTICPPDRLPREGETIFERVTSRSKPDYVVDEHGCWVWQKYKLHGYAVSGAKKMYRVYWERANGPVPPDHDVHHACKNRACINPAHLEAIHKRDHDIHHFLGERTGGLTLEQIGEIRELGKTGATSHEVGPMYGISEATVRDYWRGRRWAQEFGDGIIRPENRTCAFCAGPIPRERSRKAVYCKVVCRSRANREKNGVKLDRSRWTA